MFKHIIICSFAAVLLSSCGNKEEVKQTEEEKRVFVDSVSRAQQKHKADSLKKLNPLLIMPPDSLYTGEYVDKYPTGITKYTGFFRFGKRHGQWVSFYQTGLPWSEQSYDKGKREGLNVVYYDNSKVRYKGYYKNDLRDSTWNFYDSTGKLMKTILYKEDKELTSK